MTCPENLRWLRFIPLKLQIVTPCLFALLGAWIGDKNIADFWNIYVAGGFFLGLPVGIGLQWMKMLAVRESQELRDERPTPDSSPYWLVRGFAPLIGALFAIGVTILVCTIVVTRLPDEQALTVSQVGNGATEYCLQTIQEGVVVPLAVLTCLISITIFALVFHKFVGLPQKDAFQSPVAVVRNPLDRIGRALGCGILAFLMLVIGVLLLWGIVIQPVFLVRSVVVDGGTVQLHSALRSWTVRGQDIQEVDIIEPDARPGYVTYQMLIRERFHSPFQTVDLRFPETDPRLPKARTILEDLKKALLAGR